MVSIVNYRYRICIQLLITLNNTQYSSLFLLKFFVPFNRRCKVHSHYIPFILNFTCYFPFLYLSQPQQRERFACPYSCRNRNAFPIRNRNNKREKYEYLCNQPLEIRILARTEEELNGEKQTNGGATLTRRRERTRKIGSRQFGVNPEKLGIRRQEIPAWKCSTVRFFNLHLLWLA